jgi:hypothetical protein
MIFLDVVMLINFLRTNSLIRILTLYRRPLHNNYEGL